ncbi:MAG TPA: lipopolysaccharide assembly protein LapA domain-containing protein [Solirubrobacteraceae bacterium]|nr:lipopolysaccharide assembly protein LapA domain-containing protein [Solirubrobacteraceae bacterium]
MSTNATKPAPSRRDRARTILLLCVGAIVVLFAVLNTGSVEVNWIIGKGSAPLIVVIVLSVLVGIVCCYLIERLRSRRRGTPS